MSSNNAPLNSSKTITSSCGNMNYKTVNGGNGDTTTTMTEVSNTTTIGTLETPNRLTEPSAASPRATSAPLLAHRGSGRDPPAVEPRCLGHDVPSMARGCDPPGDVFEVAERQPVKTHAVIDSKKYCLGLDVPLMARGCDLHDDAFEVAEQQPVKTHAVIDLKKPQIVMLVKTTEDGHHWQTVHYEINGESQRTFVVDASVCNIACKGDTSMGVKLTLDGHPDCHCLIHINDAFRATITTPPKPYLLLTADKGVCMGDAFERPTKIKLSSTNLGSLQQIHSDIMIVSAPLQLAPLLWVGDQNLSQIGSTLETILQKLFTNCGTEHAAKCSMGLAKRYAKQISVLRIQTRFKEVFLNQDSQLASRFTGMDKKIRAVYATLDEQHNFEFKICGGAKKYEDLFAIASIFAKELGTSLV